MKVDLILDYSQVVSLHNAKVLALLQSIYPDKRLNSISTGWRESNQYILKARGLCGDVVVGWIGIHHPGLAGTILLR